MEDTAAESLRRRSGVLDGTDKILHEVVEVLGAAIGQVVFRQGPNTLVGIQLGCVGGEMLQAQTRVLPQELIPGCAFRGGGIVQKHDHGAAPVPP